MFRFTIRDVLWLTVMVGLAVGWWLDHDNLSDALHVTKTSENLFRNRAVSLEDLMRYEDYDVAWWGEDSPYGRAEKNTGGPTYSLEPGVHRSGLARAAPK